MEKSDLKPGMKVRNKITGRTGEVRGISGEELGCADWCVSIRSRTTFGKHKGRWEYPIWRVANLEIVPG